MTVWIERAEVGELAAALVAAGLLHRYPEIVDEVRDLLRQLESALGQSDLLPLLEAALRA